MPGLEESYLSASAVAKPIDVATVESLGARTDGRRNAIAMMAVKHAVRQLSPAGSIMLADRLLAHQPRRGYPLVTHSPARSNPSFERSPSTWHRVA